MTKPSQILDKINELNLSPEVYLKISEYFRMFEKEIEERDLVIKGIKKENNISGQILSNIIDDLHGKQAEVKLANEQLQNQKQEIELKNAKLIHQKILVDNQQATLEQKIQELENSYAELEQFSYIASHDLKSPLRNIGTFAQLLQKKLKGKLDDQEKEFVSFIVKGTRQMSCTIDDLLNYSRVGVKNADFQILDVNEIVELVKFNLTQEINDNNVLFRAERRPVVKVEVEEDEEFYLFSVKDNGVGMEEKFQKKAFEPFQRLNNQERPGTGMGLAICRKIALLHHGDIRYESDLGKGTSFYFRISKTMKSQNKAQKILVESSN